MINGLYSPSLALLTDLYELTMGFGYWSSKIHDRRAVFHLFFRRGPFGSPFAIVAGLGPAVEWLCRFRVEKQDVDFLRSLDGNDGQPLFSSDFLAAIDGMRLEVDVDAMPEGTVAMAHQPLIRMTPSTGSEMRLRSGGACESGATKWSACGSTPVTWHS
jgi:nicotinate phosphoribosyltransferase